MYQENSTVSGPRKDPNVVAQCSACGEIGRLWLGQDEDGRTVHLRHDPADDCAYVCGPARVGSPLTGRRYRPPTTSTWRPPEEFYRRRREPSTAESGEVGR